MAESRVIKTLYNDVKPLVSITKAKPDREDSDEYPIGLHWHNEKIKEIYMTIDEATEFAFYLTEYIKELKKNG